MSLGLSMFSYCYKSLGDSQRSFHLFTASSVNYFSQTRANEGGGYEEFLQLAVSSQSFLIEESRFKFDVTDTSGGCGASYSIEVVSEQFEGKRLLERHRLVNAALVEEMKHIHALSITKALTPDQWKEQEAKTTKEAA